MWLGLSKRVVSQLALERPMQQRLEQVLRLAFCFALLHSEPLKPGDNPSEALL